MRMTASIVALAFSGINSLISPPAEVNSLDPLPLGISSARILPPDVFAWIEPEMFSKSISPPDVFATTVPLAPRSSTSPPDVERRASPETLPTFTSPPEVESFASPPTSPTSMSPPDVPASNRFPTLSTRILPPEVLTTASPSTRRKSISPPDVRSLTFPLMLPTFILPPEVDISTVPITSARIISPPDVDPSIFPLTGPVTSRLPPEVFMFTLKSVGTLMSKCAPFPQSQLLPRGRNSTRTVFPDCDMMSRSRSSESIPSALTKTSFLFQGRMVMSPERTETSNRPPLSAENDFDRTPRSSESRFWATATVERISSPLRKSLIVVFIVEPPEEPPVHAGGCSYCCRIRLSCARCPLTCRRMISNRLSLR